MLILGILFASYTGILWSMQGTLAHYQFKNCRYEIIQKYRHTSVADACAKIGITLDTKQLYVLCNDIGSIHPAVFNTITNKQDETTSLFVRLAQVPDTVQKRILDYTLEKETTQQEFDIIRGICAINPESQPYAYKDAILQICKYKTNKAPFLDFTEMCSLNDSQADLCRSIYATSQIDKKARLNLDQEKILYTLPAHLKQKFVHDPLFPKQFLFQRSYKERIWFALAAGSNVFWNIIRNAYKDKDYKIDNKGDDKCTHIFNFAFAGIWALGTMIYSLWTSRYEFPHEKAMQDI
ncbi:MAG TPA: hypothetical protein VGW78_06480 [Candidatus Babeliales bacterium]|jgi:hypothetical protein|nr:hypothetical protein [Candidatus Babeliales bacterium]